MDKYSVKLSPRALRDLDGIYSYIARTLLEPETALKLVDTITEEILSLDSMPRRCPERKTGAAGLPVHGYAHLLAIASVRGGSIDVIDGHEHQPGSVFAHVAGPLAHALLAVDERLLGVVSR